MNNNLNQYLATALWSTNDESGDPLDKNYSIDDFSEEALEKAQTDLTSFLNQAGGLIEDLDHTDVAHDFWLTRNGHGAGFWDGDYDKEVGEKLTKLSKTFPEVTVEVGDDKKLYFFP